MATQDSSMPEGRTLSVWTVLAFVVAATASVGSIYLSLGLGLKACPLCFYQRTFAMSLTAVLALGLLTGGLRAGQLGLLTLPLALGGLGVAMFHVSLEVNGTLECPKGIFGLGTAPMQSLTAFAVLMILLLLDMTRMQRGIPRAAGALLALVLSGGIIWASCKSNPPLPPPPDKPYPGPPEVCRPPYQARAG